MENPATGSGGCQVFPSWIARKNERPRLFRGSSLPQSNWFVPGETYLPNWGTGSPFTCGSSAGKSAMSGSICGKIYTPRASLHNQPKRVKRVEPVVSVTGAPQKPTVVTPLHASPQGNYRLQRSQRRPLRLCYGLDHQRPSKTHSWLKNQRHLAINSLLPIKTNLPLSPGVSDGGEVEKTTQSRTKTKSAKQSNALKHLRVHGNRASNSSAPPMASLRAISSCGAFPVPVT